MNIKIIKTISLLVLSLASVPCHIAANWPTWRTTLQRIVRGECRFKAKSLEIRCPNVDTNNIRHSLMVENSRGNDILFNVNPKGALIPRDDKQTTIQRPGITIQQKPDGLTVDLSRFPEKSGMFGGIKVKLYPEAMHIYGSHKNDSWESIEIPTFKPYTVVAHRTKPVLSWVNWIFRRDNTSATIENKTVRVAKDRRDNI